MSIIKVGIERQFDQYVYFKIWMLVPNTPT